MEENIILPRKEREKKQKRGEILAAATKLFAHKGFNNTTLDEIAETAEFGKGTIYNYFASKEEIFNSIIKQVMEDHLTFFGQADKNSASFLDFLKNATSNIVDYCIQNVNAFFVLTDFFLQEYKRGGYESIKKVGGDKIELYESVLINRIVRAINDGEIKNVNPHQFAILYNNIVFPYVIDIELHKELKLISKEEHVNFIIDLIFNGIKK